MGPTKSQRGSSKKTSSGHLKLVRRQNMSYFPGGVRQVIPSQQKLIWLVVSKIFYFHPYLFFYFHPQLGEDEPILTSIAAYFSKGLKPPTSDDSFNSCILYSNLFRQKANIR